MIKRGKDLELRLKYMRKKLDNKYIPKSIREEIEEDIRFLEKMQHALYFY